MREMLEKLTNRLPLSHGEARSLLRAITEGSMNDNQIAAFLGLFRSRALTVDELAGFREAMLEAAPPVDLSSFDPVDLCGTGGDGKDTFNISTLAAFVTAACGVSVAKHGNYGVSSVCGSSNVLEYLGVPLRKTHEELLRDLERANICFLHAPFFHPAMKNVGPVRRSLGFRTFFNILGPLVNPARPRHQMIGVSDPETQRLFAYLLQRENLGFSLVTSFDGYDEISLTGPFKVFSNIEEQVLTPESIGMERVDPALLSSGGSIDEAARIFIDVLSGKAVEARLNIVAVNAGVAIACARNGSNLAETSNEAREAIDSGGGLAVLERLLERSAA